MVKWVVLATITAVLMESKFQKDKNIEEVRNDEWNDLFNYIFYNIRINNWKKKTGTGINNLDYSNHLN